MNVLRSRDEIVNSIEQLSVKLNEDFGQDSLQLVQINSAAYMFTEYLLKHLKIKTYLHQLLFQENQNIELGDDLKNNIEGNEIILLDGIIITGKTHYMISEELKKYHPKKISIVCIGKKPKYVQYEIPRCYSLYDFEDEWVVGFGIGNDEYNTQECLIDTRE